MSRPALPIILLEHGPWRAEVYDPRPDPLTLGGRYVHGGYVRALLHGERQLTSRVQDGWSRFDGEGLPETFENSLGWGATPLNEEYLRIGAGRLRRLHNSPREGASHQPLCTVLEWTIPERSARSLTMCTQDTFSNQGAIYGYRLERRVALHDDGLESTTKLTLLAENWQGHAITWFAHPFFAQDAVSDTALAFPGTPAVSGPLACGPDGRWRMQEHQGRAVITNLWGSREPIVVHLPGARGGGSIALDLDRPLDHAVAFATHQVTSVEPKLARYFTHNETAQWTLRYRFQGAPAPRAAGSAA